MKTVRVQIEQYGYDRYFEFDNMVPRGEVIHAVLNGNKQYQEDRGETRRDQEAWDRGVYLTWYDGDTETARKAVGASVDPTDLDASTEPVAPKSRATKASQDEVEEQDAG